MVRKSNNDLEPCPFCQAPTITEPLRTSQDILACLEHFRRKKQEYFICLSLNSDSRLIARRIVSIGSLTSTLAHPREVFAGAISDHAACVVVAHNHPSDIAEPSGEDIKTTQQLVAAGILLGIPLRDHIIVTSDTYYSFRANSLLL